MSQVASGFIVFHYIRDRTILRDHFFLCEFICKNTGHAVKKQKQNMSGAHYSLLLSVQHLKARFALLLCLIFFLNIYN